MIRTIFTLLVVTFISGCYYDNKSELYPSTACDTINIGFSNFVKPLINKDCIACHGGSSPIGVVPLNDHTEIAASAKTGKLYGSVSHASGFKAMPQGGNKWSDCDLKKIKIWIDNGTPNN